jgi:hypothetical protein
VKADAVRVYVDARPVDVPGGGTALDAVRIADPGAAASVEQGVRAIADSRGLPIDPGSLVHGGAIFRLISARNRPLAGEL